MPENSRCGFSIRYVAVRSTVFKNWTAQARTPCVPAGHFAYQQRSSTGTHLATDVSGAAGGAHLLCGRYRGDAMDVAIHDAYRDLRTGRPCHYRPARPSPCFRANGACLRPAGAHDGTYARSIGTDLSGEVLRGGVARNALARWSVAADGAGTHRRRYLAGDAGAPCWRYQ